MREYKHKYLLRSFFYSKGFLFFLILISIFMMQKVSDIYLKYENTRQSLETSQKEEFALKNKLSAAEDKLLNMDSERGKEEYIREVFPVKKAGEEVVIIYDTKPATYEIPKDETFLEKIKEWYNILIEKINIKN